ncbi:hypothetical protein F2P81_008267 [Scophthalmus maximus]|uniref:Uncharacterized protein n=1 Tax=Scophthalmus maximus TaxID=52904 RepID=A0A6A4TCV8_SCOMX|nr:hypothetical protein F2P81_008267 [Scophthalmus maximus]
MKAPAAFQSLAVYNTTLRRTSTAARKLIVPTIARLSPFFRRRINFRVLLKLFTPLLVADLLYSVTRFRQIIKTNITCGTKSRLARALICFREENNGCAFNVPTLRFDSTRVIVPY